MSTEYTLVGALDSKSLFFFVADDAKSAPLEAEETLHSMFHNLEKAGPGSERRLRDGPGILHIKEEIGCSVGCGFIPWSE